MKTVVDLPMFRRAMKVLGYQVRVTTHSTFKTATVLDNGQAINRGNVLSPEFFEKYRDFFAYREKHSVRDDQWIVTI